MQSMLNAYLRMVVCLTMPASAGPEKNDRGDVPGWVLITVMTAGLVGALWAVAGDRLQSMLEAALSSVGG